eukprot:TRINITY_DN7969_c0_g1_i2.p1 TRINITY_DN7969_c0_g1~~TRINITY_DN7969_c0_g1_i2.p1  ORF type:complete len:269 (-),score=56.01 TRINITY_DN7969_c0_g1_i2:188-994(-)
MQCGYLFKMEYKDDQPAPESIINTLRHGVILTKQRILDSLGQTEEQSNDVVDEETRSKLDKLQFITDQYDQLIQLSSNLLANFKSFSESQKLFGNHLYECGIKEEHSSLKHALQDSGNIHRSCEKNSVELIKSLTTFVQTVQKFRTIVIEDALSSVEKLDEAKSEYYASLSDNEDTINDANSTQSDKDDANKICEASKKQLDKISKDIQEKIIILNYKRLQELKDQLKLYMSSLQSYFSKCSALSDYDIQVKAEVSEEFKNMLESGFK